MAMEKKRVFSGTQKQMQRRRKKTKKATKTESRTMMMMKKKKFLKNLFEYLTSDSYMYAPLVSSSSSSPSGFRFRSLATGPLGYLKSIFASISTRKSITARQHKSENSPNLLEEDHSVKACHPDTDFVDEHHLRRIMVKPMVQRSSLSCTPVHSTASIKCSTISEPMFSDFCTTKSNCIRKEMPEM